MSDTTEIRYTVTAAAPERIRAIDGNGHMPERDPDYEKWAAYWQAMREYSFNLLGEAFDEVAESLAAGGDYGTVEVVMFCAEESRSLMGITVALYNLLRHNLGAHQVAVEHQAGVAMDDLVKIAGL